jgi:hypothetical protein
MLNATIFAVQRAPSAGRAKLLGYLHSYLRAATLPADRDRRDYLRIAVVRTQQAQHLHERLRRSPDSLPIHIDIGRLHPKTTGVRLQSPLLDGWPLFHLGDQASYASAIPTCFQHLIAVFP